MPQFSIREAADAAKSLSKLFQNMEKIGSVLAGIGDVEAYLAEAKQSSVAKAGELENLNAELSSAAGLLDTAKADLVGARTEASNVVSRAKTRAAQMIEKAEGEIAQLKADDEAAASVSRDTQLQEKADLEDEITALKDAKAVAEEEWNEAQTNLNDLYDRMRGSSEQ